jgi:NADH:ubiquinone oxidoreductase subunit 6 (subunit J)
MIRQLGRVPTGSWMLVSAAVLAFAAVASTDATGDWSFSNRWVEAGPAATAFCTALAARLRRRSIGELVGWTLFAPFVWALCLAPALVVLALVVGLVSGHGIK